MIFEALGDVTEIILEHLQKGDTAAINISSFQATYTLSLADRNKEKGVVVDKALTRVLTQLKDGDYIKNYTYQKVGLTFMVCLTLPSEEG